MLWSRLVDNKDRKLAALLEIQRQWLDERGEAIRDLFAQFMIRFQDDTKILNSPLITLPPRHEHVREVTDPRPTPPSVGP